MNFRTKRINWARWVSADCCPNCSLSDKLKEDDYDDIPDDPSLPVSMEVDQVTLALVGEAGRSSGEVNTALCQNNSHTGWTSDCRLPLEKLSFQPPNSFPPGIQSSCRGYVVFLFYFLSWVNVLLLRKYIQLIMFFSVAVSVCSMYSSAVWNDWTGQRTTGSREVKLISGLIIVPSCYLNPFVSSHRWN